MPDMIITTSILGSMDSCCHDDCRVKKAYHAMTSVCKKWSIWVVIMVCCDMFVTFAALGGRVVSTEWHTCDWCNPTKHQSSFSNFAFPTVPKSNLKKYFGMIHSSVSHYEMFFLSQWCCGVGGAPLAHWLIKRQWGGRKQKTMRWSDDRLDQMDVDAVSWRERKGKCGSKQRGVGGL